MWPGTAAASCGGIIPLGSTSLVSITVALLSSCMAGGGPRDVLLLLLLLSRCTAAIAAASW